MHRLPASALLALLLSLGATSARGDIIEPGTTYVRHEIRIELGRDFPDTSFVVFPTEGIAPWVQGEQVEHGVAVITSASPGVPLGKFGVQARVWAIRGPLPAKPQEITRAWLTERGAVCSEHVFRKISQALEDEGIDRVRTVFRIVEVTGATVRLEGVTEERIAPDGTIKSRSVPRVADRPVEDRRGGFLDRSREQVPTGLAMAGLDPAHTPALALAIAAVALGVLLLRRRPPALLRPDPDHGGRTVVSIGWPAACALTLAVEVPLAALLAPAGKRARTTLDAVLLNLLTHPLAWYLVRGEGLPLAPVEVLVTLVEGLGYWRVTRLEWRRAAGISVLCNAVTTFIGVAIWWASRPAP